MTDAPLPEQIIRYWIRHVVVGRRLCPFATGTFASSEVHDVAVRSIPGDNPQSALEAFVISLHDFVESPADTLVLVFPQTFCDFSEFMDGVNIVLAYLEESNLEADIQLAYFHPEFLFEGEAPDSSSHYTNRAPLPAIQLLRVEQMEAAVAEFRKHHDPAKIYEINIETMASLSTDELEAIRTPQGISVVGLKSDDGDGLFVPAGTRMLFASPGIKTERTFRRDVRVCYDPQWCITTSPDR